MNKHTLIILALLASNTCDANIIQKLLDYKSNSTSLNGRSLVRIKSDLIPGTYYYKQTKPIEDTQKEPSVEFTPMTPQEIETARIAVAEQNARIAAKEKQTKEPEVAEKDDRELVYGDGGVMEDPFVLEAWARAKEAQHRLEKHREYMKEVMKAKKQIESSKKDAAGLDVKSPEST